MIDGYEYERVVPFRGQRVRRAEGKAQLEAVAVQRHAHAGSCAAPRGCRLDLEGMERRGGDGSRGVAVELLQEEGHYKKLEGTRTFLVL